MTLKLFNYKIQYKIYFIYKICLYVYIQTHIYTYINYLTHIFLTWYLHLNILNINTLKYSYIFYSIYCLKWKSHLKSIMLTSGSTKWVTDYNFVILIPPFPPNCRNYFKMTSLVIVIFGDAGRGGKKTFSFFHPH